MAHAAGPRERVILGVETSCDDTCAAVVTAAGEVRSNVVASQGLLHARYGGVVPEVASRRHLELVGPVVEEALAEAGRRNVSGQEVTPFVLSFLHEHSGGRTLAANRELVAANAALAAEVAVAWTS